MAKAKHAPRRPRQPGGTPRKLYPYVTAEQRKNGLAPAMEKFINNNSASLEQQGNASAAVRNAKRMSQKQAKGGLKRSWGNTQKRGTGASKIQRAMRTGNYSTRTAAKRAIIGAHDVSFGADPKSK